MNEMIYGNTGRRDEGINIDMEQSLYQKLQSRTFVPKLKSMLNDRLQGGDKNFVFIGEIADKAGKFSVYGYNAKLESDSRGGDYGHYIAVPLNGPTASLDIDNVKFLTEEGFVEYVNLKTLNDDKRFTLFSSPIEVNEDTKKRMVNNLMETFMKVRKRKNVTFSFKDTGVEEFTAQSIYVLMDLMKYLPYQMRKNISFLSHVASNQKLPDMINLAAYPESSEFKPHDCIIFSDGVGMTEGAFSAYVEKVFAMSEAEREAYFEKIYSDIESPAISAGIDVRSDLYLLDVSTKELWTVGDAKEAVKSIFGSVDDVLKIYPEYRNIAKSKIEDSAVEFTEYILAEIEAVTNVDELKAVYESVRELYEVCEFPLDEDTIGFFRNRANRFVESVTDSDSLIGILEGIIAINPMILDQELAKITIRQQMSKESSVNDVNELYMKLKEGKFIDPHELNVCLSEIMQEKILGETEGYEDSKDKLSVLERMYARFESETSAKDYPRVTEVFDTYKAKFNSGANAEAIKKGNAVLDRIQRDIVTYCDFYEIKNYIKELADIEVGIDEELKRRTTRVYEKISEKLFEELEEELSYDDLEKLIEEITPAVKALDKKEIYDARLRSSWGSEKYAADGIYRFVEIVGSLIVKLRQTDNLTEALKIVETARKDIQPDEHQIKKVFKTYNAVILGYWLEKHRKAVTKSNYKKAKKELDKKYEIELSDRTKSIVERYLEPKSSKKEKKEKKEKEPDKGKLEPSKHKKKGKINIGKLIFVIIAAIVIIAALVIGGIYLAKALSDKSDKKQPEVTETEKPIVIEQGPKYFLTQDDKKSVEDYLKKFNKNKLNEATFVIATIEKQEKTDDSNKQKVICTLNIKEKLDSNVSANLLKTVEYMTLEGSNEYLKMEDVKEEKQYAVVLQTSEDGKNVYIRDIYPVSQELTTHNFDTKAAAYKKDFASNQANMKEQDLQTYVKILKYIGWQKDSKVVGLEEQTPQ